MSLIGEVKETADLVKQLGNLELYKHYLDDIQKAIAAYKEAIRIRPNFAQPHFNLGLVYAALGNKPEALEDYRILESLDGDRAEKLFKLIYNKRKRGFFAHVATSYLRPYRNDTC